LRKLGHKVPDLPEILKAIMENREKWQQELKIILPKLTFEQRWSILKTALPDLEKNRARDVVRLFMAGNLSSLKTKLEDPAERLFAVECLSYLPSRETVELLVELLQHNDEYVQICAAGALKNHTPRLVVPYLVKAMLYNRILPARVGEVLLVMGYLAQDTLLNVYPLAIPKVKAQILELLTQGGNPKCRQYLADALSSQSNLLRSKALDAVDSFKFDDLWLEVVDCLLDPNWATRARALDVLANLGIREARPYVELLLNDPDLWVRQCAANCLTVLDNRSEDEEANGILLNEG